MPPVPRSKGNAKNDEVQLLDRRKKVASMYLEGKAQHEIAAVFGVSTPTICNDLKVIREAWTKEMVDDINVLRLKELAKIDHLEEIAWEAWWRSVKDAESVTTEETLLGDEESSPQVPQVPSTTTRDARDPRDSKGPKVLDKFPTVTVTKRKRTVKGQVGEPRFMEQVRWCIEMRTKLCGLIKEDDKGKAVNVNVFNFDSLLERPQMVDPAAERIQALLPRTVDSETVNPLTSQET